MLSFIFTGLCDVIETSMTIEAMRDFNKNPSNSSIKSSDVVTWSIFNTFKWYLFATYVGIMTLILFPILYIKYKCWHNESKNVQNEINETEILT